MKVIDQAKNKKQKSLSYKGIANSRSGKKAQIKRKKSIEMDCKASGQNLSMQEGVRSSRSALQLLKAEEKNLRRFANSVESEDVGICDELRNSLMIVTDYAETLKESCEDVLTNSPPEIRKPMGKLSQMLYAKARQAQYSVDNFLLQLQCIVQGKLNEDSFQSASITQSIEETLEKYPFKSGERAVIEFQSGNDFEYMGNMQCTNYLLFSLIKNFLSAIRSGNKEKISIKLEADENFNKLIFKSTAACVMEERLPLLHSYFRISDQKAAANLCFTFSKIVMKSYGGSVSYSCTEKAGTEFILNFPKLHYHI